MMTKASIPNDVMNSKKTGFVKAMPFANDDVI